MKNIATARIRPIRGILLAWLLIMHCTPVSAARTAVGVVSSVITRSSDGLVFFYVNGTTTGDTPTCTFNPTAGINTTYWIIPSEGTTVGKNLIAALMMAKTTGRAVRVTGTGNCTRWYDGEDVLMIEVM